MNDKIIAATLPILLSLCLVSIRVLGQYGEYKDPRDNKIYATVQIGKQIWMAQNLAYRNKDIANEEVFKSGFKSKEFEITTAYQADKNNYEKFGMLYSWKTAKEVCPVGWHLPMKEEFESLLASLGNNKKSRYAKLTTLWKEDSLFGGRLYVLDQNRGRITSWRFPWRYHGLSKVGLFWSATKKSDGFIVIFGVNRKLRRLQINDSSQNHGLSVRCVKD